MSLILQLRETEPFNHLPEDLFKGILDGAKLRRYPPNVQILRQDDPPTGFLYVIKKGLVEITVCTPDGVDMVVDFRQEGTFFGGTPIFTGEPYTGGAHTVTATECYLIPQHLLKEAEKDYPQLSAYFTRIVLSRVRRLFSEIATEHSRKALLQMEAYPFQKRLSEIMVAPVESSLPDETVRRVARRMTDKNIGAMLVVDERNSLLGILTDRDLVHKVLARENTDPGRLTAGEVMSPGPHFMAPETYMYEAMAYMNGHRIKHLPIVDRGELVGIVSLRDLLRYRSQKAMTMIGNIREECSLPGLAAIHREMLTVARTMLSETSSTMEVMEILSYIHHGIIRRVFELCLEEMQAQGHVIPDIRYTFLIMGSGGRREMLLGPDQDNGFLFEDFPDAMLPQVEGFFAPLGEKVVQALAQVGYPTCKGAVMVNNPAWRGRLRDWHSRIRDWVNDPEPLKVRSSSIFFDFASVAGDPELAGELRNLIRPHLRDLQGLLYNTMFLDLRYKVPIGMLGRFLVEKDGEHQGELSLKRGGSVYLVECIRMYALEKGLWSATTMERLKRLVEHNVFAQETAEHISAAFEALTFLRLRNEISLLHQGRAPSHFLDPHALPTNEQDLLRESLGAVKKLKEATRRHYAKLSLILNNP